jgi:mRNA interferase MazF
MNRGEVWLINLDPTAGAEIRKTRPAVVVSIDAVGLLPLRVVVPLTEWKARYGLAPWMVRLDLDRDNGLEKPSAADTCQVRSFSVERFVRRLGTLQTRHIQSLTNALTIVLGVTEHAGVA